MKKALAILGDAWHAPHITRRLMEQKLKEVGYESTILTDYTPVSSYAVNFSSLKQNYDLVIISRYALDDYKSYQDIEKKKRVYWLTQEQQEQLEAFVLEGGSLFLHHDGIGFYPKESIMCKLARCFCINHPIIIPIHVEPKDFYDSLNSGITAYDTADEEFNVEMDEENTQVFLESITEQNGRHPQGWCHTYGQGKVAVFIPGHDSTVQRHPMVEKGIENALRWLSVSEEEK